MRAKAPVKTTNKENGGTAKKVACETTYSDEETGIDDQEEEVEVISTTKEVEVISGTKKAEDHYAEQQKYLAPGQDRGFNKTPLFDCDNIQEPYMSPAEQMENVTTYLINLAEIEVAHANARRDASQLFLRRQGISLKRNNKETQAYPSHYLGKPGKRSAKEKLHDSQLYSGRKSEYKVLYGDYFEELCLGKKSNKRSFSLEQGLKEVRMKEVRSNKKNKASQESAPSNPRRK